MRERCNRSSLDETKAWTSCSASDKESETEFSNVPETVGRLAQVLDVGVKGQMGVTFDTQIGD